MPIVKATREGLVGRRTATNAIVDIMVPFVALPCVAALHQWIDVRSLVTGATCRAIVLDVGPWNTQDAAYVYGSARPQAENGIDKTGRVTNGAGIDLGEYVWQALQLRDNSLVEWEFCMPALVDRGAQLTADQVRVRLAKLDLKPSTRPRSTPAPPTGAVGP